MSHPVSVWEAGTGRKEKQMIFVRAAAIQAENCKYGEEVFIPINRIAAIHRQNSEHMATFTTIDGGLYEVNGTGCNFPLKDLFPNSIPDTFYAFDDRDLEPTEERVESDLHTIRSLRDDCVLSIRTSNVILRALWEREKEREICLEDMKEFTRNEIMKLRGMGKRSMKDLEIAMRLYGVTFKGEQYE